MLDQLTLLGICDPHVAWQVVFKGVKPDEYEARKQAPGLNMLNSELDPALSILEVKTRLFWNDLGSPEWSFLTDYFRKSTNWYMGVCVIKLSSVCIFSNTK